VSRGRTLEERRIEAEAALARLEHLPVEPICVRVATAKIGWPTFTLYAA
jgi:hypothetical protein